MSPLNLKFITFEKPNFPSVYLEPTLKPQLIAFNFDKPYLLSFQPILKSDPAFYLDVYNRVPGGGWAGHFYGTVHHQTLILQHKEIVPENQKLFEFVQRENIGINFYKRYHLYTFAFETKLRGVGLGTILFGLGFKIAKELYDTHSIRIETLPENRPYYLNRFKEHGVESVFHPDNRVLLGKWV
jgi:hypothetical protein